VVEVIAQAARPGEARKAFRRNLKFFGIDNLYRFQHPELMFLCLIVTAAGVCPSVAKQVNFLFDYLRLSKPHGFRNQAAKVVRLCWLLS
jgi:hypothetical protein